MATMKKRVEPSKELELLNFKAFLLENPDQFVGSKTQSEQINVASWYSNNKVSPEPMNTKSDDVNQFLLFQRAMKILLICGQFLGLNPVTGILENDVTKIRYRWFSWRVIYVLILATLQSLATIISIYRLIRQPLYFVRSLAFCSFFVCTSSCTFMFLRVACKWPALMKELQMCGLHQYCDPKTVFKCHLACYIITFLAVFEFILSQTAKYVEVFDCNLKGSNMYENFFKVSFPWVYSLETVYYLPLGILLQLLITVTTFCWSYPDLFTICISIYLNSILKSIVEKIKSTYKNNYLPPSFWRHLREDYNRATQLVRSFDDIISGVVFISFANNMFFICLQLYYSLANGLRFRQKYFEESCPNYPSGPFGGYETTIYLAFSIFFLISKFVSVSLITSNVHTSSMKVAPALYNVASSMYCDEVQRFLDQVHSDTVALSGFQFFYVTREIILSVAGTIVTYELVMLQFSN